MIGAIAGDIIGSVYEFDNIKTTVFPLFTRKSNYTDDTIMTVAVTDWLLYGGNLVQVMHRYGREFPCPMGGYGARFGQWLCETNPQPYNSWGNGSAMRVSAVGWAFGSLEKTLQVAEETAAVSHNHPEGIKGAQAVAAVIYLARTGKSKQAIREYIETTFLYDLNFSCDEIRPDYCFNPSCQGTVPEAIVAFLESTDFETAIRLAISLGGDSDTLACITGGIAEAFYGMSEDWKIEVLRRLPEAFVEVVEEFSQINVIDKDQNEASIWYVDDIWKMTRTKIADFNQLSLEAQTVFENSKYRFAQFENIYKTEREGMDRSLYTLHFLYQWKNVKDMTHYVCLNDDGMFLAVYTWTPNDSTWFVDLPKAHFDFIYKKYDGSEIRGYQNNGGYYDYFVLHNDTLKFVSFRGEVETDYYFWKETRYEISLDTKVPDNVARVLKRDNPDFVYTNLYYIESPEGNAYFFQDKNDDRELGYTIAEDIS